VFGQLVFAEIPFADHVWGPSLDNGWHEVKKDDCKLTVWEEQKPTDCDFTSSYRPATNWSHFE